jgi:hypothetical protein
MRRGVQGKRMRLRLIALACVILSAISAQEARGQSQTFKAWKVDILVDDFEGEVKPTLTADVFSVDGQKIGTMSIGYFVAPKGVFSSALVSFSIRGLRGSFPDCDYEFLKYKIDSAESAYFPTRGYACPSLEIRSAMVDKLSAGQSFRFSASGQTGVVSLKGFKEAWAYTLSRRNTAKVTLCL